MIVGLFLTIGICIFALAIIFQMIREKMLPPERKFNRPQPPPISPDDIVIIGREFDINRLEVEMILQKRCPYFNELDWNKQQKFLNRTERFLRRKVFVIKDDKGFKDMPVLVSAAAVQLTFGLSDYLLPWFHYIQIYSEEFWSDHSFKVLAGNVSNHTITVAWNHLLKGNENYKDGSNVALHEMSHALYFQKVEVEKEDAYSFCKQYDKVISHCEAAFDVEVSGRTDLYSDYATTNLQEFWAESIELFFEKGEELKKCYPEVFKSLVILLNQDPLTVNKIVVNRDTILYRAAELLRKF